MPTFSIIIPTYAHRDLIEETLASVFGQTYTDYEILVVNDGSPDDTAEVLRPWVTNGKIRYFEQPNAGQGAARNRGLAEAAGEFIAFLDDDDLWPSDNLQRHAQALRENPAAVLSYGDVRTFPFDKSIDRFLQLSSRTAKNEILLGNPLVTPGQVVVRRSALVAVGGFDAAIWGCDDWDLYVRLADQGPFVYAGHTAVRYRIHQRNASKNRLRMFENAMKVFAKNRPGDADERDCWREGRQAVRRLGGRFAVDESCERIVAGDYGQGLAGLLRVCRLSPDIAFRRSVWKQILGSLWGAQKGAR